MSSATDDVWYRVQEFQFNGKSKYVVHPRQKDKNKSLVALSNLLLLKNEAPSGIFLERGRGKGQFYVGRSRLVKMISSALEQALRGKFGDDQEAIQKFMTALEPIISSLHADLDMFPIIKSTTSFKGKSNANTIGLLKYLEVPVFHGILCSPEVKETYEVVHGRILTELTSRYVGDVPEEARKLKLIKKFIDASDLYNSYGLSCMKEDVKEDCLSLIWIRRDLYVLYKHNGVLLTLAAGEGLAHVWESLVDEGEPQQQLASDFTPAVLQIIATAYKVIEEEKAQGKKTRRGGQKKELKQTEVEGSESDKTCTNPCVLKDTTDSTKELKEPTLRDRFLDFLSCFKKEGSSKEFFLGQVKSMEYYEKFDLEISFSLLMEYDRKLALAIAANYQSSMEDMRLGLCDYLKKVLISDSMTKQEIKITTNKIVETATIRIVNYSELPRVQTLREFTRSNVLYTVYKFDDKMFDSTSHMGRMVGSGYLNLLLKAHRDGQSWNGQFTVDDMFIEITGEEVTRFIIAVQPSVDYNKDSGFADCDKYFQILAPYYKSHEDAKVPQYFNNLHVDCMQIPDYDPRNPAEFEKFQKFVGHHMCWEAPLVRAALLSNLYKIIAYRSGKPESVILNAVFGKLDDTNGTKWGTLVKKICKPLKGLYLCGTEAEDEIEDSHASRYSRHTLWSALWIAGNSLEYLWEYTEVDGVQLLTDLALVDLILEEDLCGILSNVVKEIMQLTNFDGEFACVWSHFEASEMFDYPLGAAVAAAGCSAPAEEAKKEEDSASMGMSTAMEST